MLPTGPCRPARKAKLVACERINQLGNARKRQGDGQEDCSESADTYDTTSTLSCPSEPLPAPRKQPLLDSNKRNNINTPAAGGPTPPAVRTTRARGRTARRPPVAQPSPQPPKDFHPAGDFPDPIPVRVQVGRSPVYISETKLGKGGFGAVYLGRRADGDTSEEPVAIKFEHSSSKGCTYGSPYEWSVYSNLGEVYGVPKVHYTGQQGRYYIMIMDRLGPSLWDLWNTSGQRLSEPFVARFAMEGLAILRALHNKGYVHGDVKPENFLTGPSGTDREKRLYLVDLGLASRWREHSMHVKYDQKPDDFRGTMRYASIHAHLGRTPSRRDDLESLAYSCLFLLKGRLPWQGYQGDNKGFLVARHKMGMSAASLCGGAHTAFHEFLAAVQGLNFSDEPPYAAYLAMFESLASSPAERPLAIQGARRVLPRSGAKRPRSADLEAATADATATAKRLRTGAPVQQWITVYNKYKPMKQRYHCNVASNRLLVHVEKGWADGLFITSVCSCGGSWAVVMDGGTGFTSQIYRVHSGIFLPKDWIMAKWEEGYYITALAGSDNMSSLLVMSKGSKFTQQSYKVSEVFPYDWIKRKWKDGFMVTATATAGSQWAVVMSRNAPYAAQVVELDFQYPSEGIHARWEEGFRITSAAATPDQAAFVLSQPKRGAAAAAAAGGLPVDDSQETLRTSSFPSTHVKDKWDRQLYISCMAYGRTVT